MNHRHLTTAVILLAAQFTLARDTKSLDFDWRFSATDPADAAAPTFDDSAWRTLDLPHDWSIEQDYDRTLPGQGGYLPGTIAWYRRTIDAPADPAQRTTIQFDAVSMNSDVYLNGHLLGHRPYHSISFVYDLTKDLHPGHNTLAVRVDTAKLPNARWYAGTGIYSHVSLTTTHPLHLATWGTAITTPTNSEVKVATDITNDSAQDADVELSTEILDPTGQSIATATTPLRLPANQTLPATTSLQVPHPALWSPDSPTLYTLVTKVLHDQQPTDQTSTPFGIRSTRWDPNTGFWLNDQNVKLHGYCMHYDAGGAIGVAVPDSLNEFRLRQIKASGANAVRVGHTPFPPVFYDLCDRIGLMVIDEAFDGWKRKAQYDYGALFFPDWWKRDLADMIRRDRNHPSVILWSMGNETGAKDIHGLSPFAHSIDPSHPTTGGQLLEGVDVSGFTGKGEAPGVLAAFHQSHPKQPILLTEETHTYATRGYYRALTWWRDANNQSLRQPDVPYTDHEVFTGGDPQYISSYDNGLVRMSCRQCTKRTDQTPWIAGEFKWSAFDYLGEAATNDRHWPLRYATEGIIDSANFPKDDYYFYQSQYAKAPMVHLLPHWTLDGMLVAPHAPVPVVAYSNCDEVELFLNGKSLGRQKPRPILDFLWTVPYTPGELKAVAYRNGKEVASETLHTARPATTVALTPDHPTLVPDRRDLALITLTALDSAGHFSPTASATVHFKLLGPATWRGAENGNPTDISPNRLPQRTLYAGLARAYVSATATDGPVELCTLAIFPTADSITLSAPTLPLRGPAGPPPQIHYTLDGSAPTVSSPTYQNPIPTKPNQTIRLLLTRDNQELLRVDYPTPAK